MFRREDNLACEACYAKDCDCECTTCVSSKERNNALSPEELFNLNMVWTRTDIEDEGDNLDGL